MTSGVKAGNSAGSTDTHALSLVVNYGGATYGREHRKASVSNSTRDLKFEIFLNGELVEVTYDNWKRTSGSVAKRGGVKVFSGTRFHRQAEKPWVYEHYGGTGNASQAQRRWNDLSQAYSREVAIRGQDANGGLPVTAQYLAALAQLAMPERVKTMGVEFGVIDIVITAGYGAKWGPGTNYQRGPSRMTDDRFKSNIPASPKDSLTARFRSVTGKKTVNAGKSLASLSILQHGNTPPKHTPMPKRSETFLQVVQNLPFELKIMNCSKAYGRASQRTIPQRMGDMVKMSPKRQTKSMQLIEAALQVGNAEQRYGRTQSISDEATLEHASFTTVESEPASTGYGEMQIDPMLDAQMQDASEQDAAVHYPRISDQSTLEHAALTTAESEPASTGHGEMQVDPMLGAEMQDAFEQDAAVQDPTHEYPASEHFLDSFSQGFENQDLGLPAANQSALTAYPDPFLTPDYNAFVGPTSMASMPIGSNFSSPYRFAAFFAAPWQAPAIDPRQLTLTAAPGNELNNTAELMNECDERNGATEDATFAIAPPPHVEDIFIEPAAPTADNKTRMERMIDMAMDYGCQPDGPLLKRLDPTLAARVPRRAPGSATLGLNPRTPAKNKGGRPRKRPVEEVADEDKVDPEWSVQATPSKRRKTGMTTRRSTSRKPTVRFENIAEEVTPTKHGATTSTATEAEQPPTPKLKSKGRASAAEESIAQALEHFEMPTMCVGSAVSYAMGNAQRQIKKERFGTFREESLVVGMRFIVI